jgi:hypothetical protein
MPFCAYSKTVYRNFATSFESQELTDDLTANSQHQEILKQFFYPDRPALELLRPIERVLRKSAYQIIQEQIDSKFNPFTWYVTRYSDGTWGVLYAAESEETALKEALYHMRKFYKEESQKKTIQVDRRVARLRAKSERAFDLLSEDDLNRETLTSQDLSGYPYCQKLAKKWISQGAELLRAPSARDPKGVCVPIFKKEAIQRDFGHLKFLRCIFHPDGNVDVLGIKIQRWIQKH